MTEPVETRGDERHEMLARGHQQRRVADVLAIDPAVASTVVSMTRPRPGRPW
jgi:hypothetical protein